jgi:hypothetical protein
MAQDQISSYILISIHFSGGEGGAGGRYSYFNSKM